MHEDFPLKIGAIYELVPYPSEDFPIVALVEGKILYFNCLEELELDGETLRFYFPNHETEFEHVKKEWWRLTGMYGKEEVIE